ncbi:uncharacterized protein [Cardiocondyla obscurior]|uniref:uncharacterized protein n=1 Tax=Cardiocondyla obscurior TaxID=286306 RepID=UPI0039658CB7
MACTILQANINHARHAQDLLIHTISEAGGGIDLISEPYKIPDGHPCWFQDSTSKSAIVWIGQNNACTLVDNGDGWVAASWNNYILISVYLPPSWLPQQVLHTGSTPKIYTIKQEQTNTNCWRLQRKINYLGITRIEPIKRKRWAVKKLNKDLLATALETATWPADTPGCSAKDDAKWLTDTLTDACSLSMPAVSANASRGAYWWNDDIAKKRRKAIAYQRTFTRTRRRKRSTQEDIDLAYFAYREARRKLKIAISKAKEDAWKELMDSIDADPWGRPYKVIAGKFRARAPPATMTLDKDQTTKVVTTLFPRNTVHNSTSDSTSSV